MADLNQHQGGSGALAEPVVRARWMPKPEQVLILESIFNSGMVNPPKDETVRIRKLLEKFGSVGDANVFYWFQNRRSRSRRRQRQLQASLMQHPASPTGGGGVPYEPTSSSYSNSSYSAGRGFFTFSPSSSSDDLFAISRQMGFMEIAQSAPPFACSSDVSHQLHCQPEVIQRFLGVCQIWKAYEVASSSDAAFKARVRFLDRTCCSRS